MKFINKDKEAVVEDVLDRINIPRVNPRSRQLTTVERLVLAYIFLTDKSKYSILRQPIEELLLQMLAAPNDGN